MPCQSAKKDKKLSEMEVSGEVSNGLVKVIMTGKGVVKSIKIDSSLKEDIEVLEDLIVAAMHEAKKMLIIYQSKK